MSNRNAAAAARVAAVATAKAAREQERRLRAAEDAPEMARRAEVVAQRKDRFATMPIQELMALRWAQPPANYASVTPDIRTKWHRLRHEVDAAYEMRSPEVDEFERAVIESNKAAGMSPEDAQWIYMGKEGSEYRLPQGTSVRFGKGDKWIEKGVGPVDPTARVREDWAEFYVNPKDGVITASTDVFGDVAPGIEKEIWRKSRAADAEIKAEAAFTAADAAAGMEEALAFHARNEAVRRRDAAEAAAAPAKAAAKAAAAAAATAELAGEAGWTLIGAEHTSHKLEPGTRVKFGKGDKWIEKVVGPEGTINATARSEDFGSDPAPGVFKEIWKRTGGRRRKTRRRKTRHHRRSKTSKRA
jgi:hypothetical protein